MQPLYWAKEFQLRAMHGTSQSDFTKSLYMEQSAGFQLCHRAVKSVSICCQRAALVLPRWLPLKLLCCAGSHTWLGCCLAVARGP